MRVSGEELLRVSSGDGQAMSEQRLFVYQGVFVASGETQFQVPWDAFGHTDPAAIVATGIGPTAAPSAPDPDLRPVLAATIASGSNNDAAAPDPALATTAAPPASDADLRSNASAASDADLRSNASAASDAVLRSSAADADSTAKRIAPVDAPTRSRRGLWVVAIVAGVIAIGAVAYLATRDDGATAVIADAGIPELRIVIGQLEGDGMTDGIRTRIRPKLAALVSKLATDVHTVLAPGPEDEIAGRAGRAMFLQGNLTTLDIAGDKLACKFQLTLWSYPEKNLHATAGGGATVRVTKSVKDIELGAADCVDAALEDLLLQRILPAIRRHASGSDKQPGSGSVVARDPVERQKDPPKRIEITGDPIMSSPGASPIEAKPPSNVGPLDKDSLKAMLHAYRAPMERCYLEQLGRDPKLTTTVVVKFDIHTDGRVGTPQATEGDEPLGNCVATVIARIPFAKPPARIEVVFSIPFRPRARSR